MTSDHASEQINTHFWHASLYSILSIIILKSGPHTLTSHGAESKVLIDIIVVRGSAPLHTVTTAIRCAVGVVAAAVQVGEVAKGAVGVAPSCGHNGW